MAQIEFAILLNTPTHCDVRSEIGHVSDMIKHNTHLQQRGPRSRLCPRRRCSSGVERLPPIQTQGTLQNRHVKSQARESHWKKIQICCAKNTNKETQHALFKLWLCVPRDGSVNNSLSCTVSSASTVLTGQIRCLACCIVTTFIHNLLTIKEKLPITNVWLS